MSPQISFRITTAYVFHFVYHERLRFLSGFFLEGSMIRQTSTLNYPLYRRSSLTGLIVGTPGGSIRHVKSPCGISGSGTAHSASIKLLGRRSLFRACYLRVSSVHWSFSVEESLLRLNHNRQNSLNFFFGQVLRGS